MKKLLLLVLFVPLYCANYNLSPEEVNKGYLIESLNVRLHTDKDVGDNSFESRGPRVIDQVLSYKPTILCMQEVSDNTAVAISRGSGYPTKFFLDELKKNGYEAILGKLSMSKHPAKKPGFWRKMFGMNAYHHYFSEHSQYCPIFFKSDQLKLLSLGTFWLNESGKKERPGFGAKYPRICTWAQFREPKTKKPFWVFNTHLLAGESSEKSLRFIVQKMHKMVKNDLSFIVGDLKMSEKQALACISTLWPHASGLHNLSSKNIGKIYGKVDHLFVNNSKLLEQVFVHSVVERKDKLPLSDHCPVLANFEIAS